MSIYYYSKRIELLTKGEFKAPPFPEIIAWKNDKVLLTINTKNDISDELLKISGKKDICINHYFWNYKYNQYEQLGTKFKEDIKDQIRVLIDHVELTSYGLFLNHILFHEILFNVYYLSEEKMNTYLDKVNIDKNVIYKLLIDYNYKLPVTINYFSLMKRIIDGPKILDLIFHKKNEEVYFNCSQIEEILEEIDFGNINDAYYIITSHPKYSMIEKLKYIKCLLEIYDNYINQEDTLYYSVKNPKLSLGVYLYSMNIEGKLTDLYYEILDLYISKNGAKNIIVIDDPELDNRIKSKLNYK